MNMLEWVESGGRVKTANGCAVDVYLSDDEEFPIAGTVRAVVPFECMWDAQGNPHRLPLTHGLALIAVVPVTTYRNLSRRELAEL